MKKYRDCVADAFAYDSVIRFLADRADDLSSDADRQIERASEDEPGDSYYLESAAEYKAKAAAFERLLTKLSK